MSHNNKSEATDVSEKKKIQQRDSSEYTINICKQK